MSTGVIPSILGLIGSLLAAVVTYWFAKKREREAEWRKEKLAHYKAFVEGLSGIVEGDSTVEGQQFFAKATNNLLLFAPQPVIEALNAYRAEISVSNSSNRTQEQHDKLLTELLIAIRRDVGVLPSDNPATFKPILWASGASKPQ